LHAEDVGWPLKKADKTITAKKQGKKVVGTIGKAKTRNPHVLALAAA